MQLVLKMRTLAVDAVQMHCAGNLHDACHEDGGQPNELIINK